MNLQAKSAASPCCIYGYSYQYRSNFLFSASHLLGTAASWTVSGQAKLTAQTKGTSQRRELNDLKGCINDY